MGVCRCDLYTFLDDSGAQMHSIKRQTEWNSHIRGGMVALWLFDGKQLTTKQIAQKTGLTEQGVDNMMKMLCLAFPIDRIGGKWQWKW